MKWVGGRAAFNNPVLRRVPPVDVRAETCPVCQAQPGDPCLTVGFNDGRLNDDIVRGRPRSTVHPPRRLLAVRRRNAASEQEGPAMSGRGY